MIFLFFFLSFFFSFSFPLFTILLSIITTYFEHRDDLNDDRITRNGKRIDRIIPYLFVVLNFHRIILPAL